MAKFLNVYNFIPFPDKKAAEDNETGNLSGVITYKIKPLTPLCIPNTSSDGAFKVSKDDKEHKSYDFFSYTSLDKSRSYDTECYEPVIPGSEIRGVIRNIYETLTDSCMGVLNYDEYPTRRVGNPFKAGIIRKESGKYFLYEASVEKIEENYRTNKYTDGEQIERNGRTVCVVKGERAKYGTKEKRKARVFIPERRMQTLDDTDLDRLEKVLDTYRDNAGSYVEYSKGFRTFRKDKSPQVLLFPVYYSVIKHGNSQMLFLSPACITREVYSYTLADYAHGFGPCSADCVCPACRLFGRVDPKGKTISSRIRFSDAVVNNKKENTKEYYYNNGSPVTLETLGGPKLSNVEFYLEKPSFDAKFWTYDYYYDRNGNIHIEKGRLRGRKYYWHHQKPNIRNGIEATKLNKTARLLKGGEGAPEFEGKLYFDSISEKTLKRLLWILNCGSSSEKDRAIAYKIGGGKPLGLGSIECTVTECRIRSLGLGENGQLNYNDRPVEFTVDDYDNSYLSNSAKDDFFVISSFKAIPTDISISYPVTDAQYGKPMQNGYEWFQQNHGRISKRDRMFINKELPGIDKDVARMLLPCTISGGYDQRPNNGRFNYGRPNYGRPRY